MVAAILAFAAAQAASLSPSSKWVVDYRPDMCVASRTFGAAETPTVFGFEPSITMDDAGAMLLIVTPASRGGVRTGEAIVTLSSGEKKTLDYVSWVIKNPSPMRAFEVTVDSGFMSKLDQSTTLSMDAGKDSIALATGPFTKVLAAMKTCTDNLLRSWGVNPAAKAEPIGSPGGWFTNDDYPAPARRRGASGRVGAVVTSDPSGRVKACRVVSSSKDPDLDRQTCDLAQRRGRYKPSTGDSFAVLGIRWVLRDI